MYVLFWCARRTPIDNSGERNMVMTDYDLKIKRYRRFLYIILACGLIALMAAAYIDYWRKVPSTIKIRAGIEQELDFHVPVSGVIYQDEAVESLSTGVESLHVDFSRGLPLKPIRLSIIKWI